MATSARLKVLVSGLRAVIAPALRDAGFSFDAGSKTFRRACAEATQIVGVQAGVRSFEGWFTVNLGIYHPTYREDPSSDPPHRPMDYHCLIRERLGVLRDTPITVLSKRLISQQSSLLGWWLTTPSDKWWRFSEGEASVRSTLLSMYPLLSERGLPWLQAHSSLEALRAARSKLTIPAAGA